MRKGVIVLVPFPFTDLSGQKVRPALILFSSLKGENCVVAFITSTQREKSYEFDVPVVFSKQNGLVVDSIIKLDHLATLQKKIILGELGMVEAVFIKDVDKKLKILLGL
ncbi:MAG: type II toxin-antitoxin system PemK/MazF family toxin [Candidatus Taylorbacteria bacterium]|nr:type II toxin-antitoxin system PemK/MazF family toxin [Candidatus Taylorbacteria bacterium]